MVRYKNRYVVVEVNPEGDGPQAKFNISEKAVCSAIWNKVEQLYGDFGCGAIANGFIVKYWNKQLRTLLIRVRHGPHRFITSSLPFVDRVSDKKVVLNILQVTGSMSSCFKFLVKYHKRKAYRDLIEMEGTAEYKEFLKSFIHVRHIEIT